MKNHTPWNKGKKIGYVPVSGFKKGQNVGAKHPRWKGGTIIYWRKQAMKRDNYTCKNCGLREPKIMQVHHLIGFTGTEKERNRKRKYAPQDINNLVTLCPNCHERLHKGVIKDIAHLKDTAHLKPR